MAGSLNESSKLLERGLHKTMVEAGGELPDAFVIDQEMTGRQAFVCEQELQVKLTRLCGHPKPPSVIFTSFDSLAELVCLILRRLRVRVPDEMSIVGFGGANRPGAITSPTDFCDCGSSTNRSSSRWSTGGDAARRSLDN
jgi:DNA-binding LacI/PurR family transcriptional regulator